MIIDEPLALKLLKRVDPTIAATTANEMFVHLVNARFRYDLSNPLHDETIAFTDAALLECIDLKYCVGANEDGVRQLLAAYIHDAKYEQFVEVIDMPYYLRLSCEEIWDIPPTITDTQVHANMQSLGATRDDAMLAWFDDM